MLIPSETHPKFSGWAEDSKTNADSSSGNVVFLRNFYDGQPLSW
jgi:hypothetical protein